MGRGREAGTKSDPGPCGRGRGKKEYTVYWRIVVDAERCRWGYCRADLDATGSL